MPFPDEVGTGVSVVDYRSEWAAEFEAIADGLRSTLGPRAVSVDHVGSTSVPGLPAKNCIDIQVRVETLDELEPLLTDVGFRLRPEPWNRVEVSSGQECRKLVFAPPVGGRSCNVHVRLSTGPNARYAFCSGTTCGPMKLPDERWAAETGRSLGGRGSVLGQVRVVDGPAPIVVGDDRSVDPFTSRAY